MDERVLQESVAMVPPGPWGVAVSGGADSVALLRLLSTRSDLSVHIVHLDHETRNGESAIDAAFVLHLAQQLGVPCTVAIRSEIEQTMPKLPANRPARFRAARMHLFKRTVKQHVLAGVILAHHADDQAETILQRLLRGAGPWALTGMAEHAVVSSLTLLRPLLGASSTDLRQFLLAVDQPWREDSSNVSPAYLRNRLRPILAANPELRRSLLALGHASAGYRAWLQAKALPLDKRFKISELATLPGPMARWSAGRWLENQGAPAGDINQQVCDRLIEMASDAASTGRRHFPGGLLVRRKAGEIFREESEG